MADLRQRIEPFRSQKYLAGSRGQTCKLRFPGICIGGTETTVPCHVHDSAFGMGRKANDWSVIDGCMACHTAYDLHRTGLTEAELYWHLLRGLQETIASRLERGLIFIPQDAAPRETGGKPRKPKERRPSAPMPGTKASGIRRRMNGTVERRT